MRCKHKTKWTQIEKWLLTDYRFFSQADEYTDKFENVNET